MVSITLSVSEHIRSVMRTHDEINWSGFIRKIIEKKARDLEKLEALKEQLKKEEHVTDWAVKLQHAARSGRLATLKRKGFL